MGIFDNFSVKNFKVNVHQSVLSPGMTLTGTLSFDVEKDITMRGLYIKCVGRERTHLEQHHHHGRQMYTEHHVETAVFFKEVFTVTGDSRLYPVHAVATLPPASYVIPFQFTLPPYLPPSGDSGSGTYRARIFYEVKSFIDIPHGRDALDRVPITILSTISPAQYSEPHAAGHPLPVTRELECCGCVSRGSVTFSVKANKDVVAADRQENIHVTIEVDNTLGSDEVTQVLFRFVNVVKATAQHHPFLASHVAWSKEVHAGVAPKEKRTIETDLEIPAHFIESNPPSVAGILMHSHWAMFVELEVPYATDPIITFPILVASRLEETLTAHMPLQVDQCKYHTILKKHMHEYVYTVPPAASAEARGLEFLPAVTHSTAVPQAPYAM